MATGYLIKTFHDTTLYNNCGKVCHKIQPNIDDCLYLFYIDESNVLIIPKKNIETFSPSGKNMDLFRFSGYEFSSPAIFCNATKVKDKENKLMILDPRYRFFLSAVCLNVGQDVGILKSGTYKAQGWEIFVLINPVDFSGKIDAYIQNFNFNHYAKSDDVIKCIVEGDLISFFNYMNVISYDELIKLSSSLLKDKEIITLLDNMFNNQDVFIEFMYKLSSCVHFTNNHFYIKTNQESFYSIDEKYDFLCDLYANDKSTTPTQLLYSYMRSLISPKTEFSASVVTTIRNEGPYIIEFVAYYKSLGFDKIFIYSNNNNDGSDELLKLLAQHGLIVYINNVVKDGLGPQKKAYMHAATFNFNVLENQWTLFVDIDEFFTFNTLLYKDVKDYLMFMSRNKVDSICLNWLFVGANGKKFFNIHETSLDSYPYASHVTHQIKSFVRSNVIGSIHCHFPYPIERSYIVSRHTNGTIQKTHQQNHGKFERAFCDDLDYLQASIVHYWSRSLYEFIYKYSKNRGDYPLNSNCNSFANFDESLASIFISYFSITKIKLDDIIGEHKLLTKKYIKEIYKHTDIAAIDMKIKNNFDKLTRNSVRNFLLKFSSCKSEFIVRLVNLVNKESEIIEFEKGGSIHS